ncbi:MAG TPA: 3-hydroxyacyl-CoA dehydrogenase [Magnetospirillaceae bacterium]|jgi:3-hydroxyacyl-CoA dehydrogenase
MARKVAIIGSGLIGRSWAICFARGGYDVAMWDPEVQSLKTSLDAIGNLLVDLEKGGLLQNQTAATVRKRIVPVRTIEEAVAESVHVQENGPEQLQVKKDLFQKLDIAAPADAVLASSSSAIPASQFTETLRGKGRCLIAHPINPPYLVPAVELVPAPWTEAPVVERTRSLMARIGMAPMILNKEVDGFVVNRLQAALLHEAFRLVEGGYASVADIDIAVGKGLGLRWSFMGPFETIDLNAPGGVADYVARYDGAMKKMAETQKEPVTWVGALTEKITADRDRRLPRAELANRQRWRDRRLMALLRHFTAAEKEIGT